MILIKLFLTFFRIGLFAIGGAYSFLPLIEKEVVEKHNWLTKEEFLDVLGIVKMFPGAISIKYATYTGYKIGGIFGAIAANLGNLLAPALLVLAAYVVYYRYKEIDLIKKALGKIELAVFAMIIAVAFQVIDINSLANFRNIAIVVISFILFMYTRVHPALIIIMAGLIGIVFK